MIEALISLVVLVIVFCSAMLARVSLLEGKTDYFLGEIARRGA